MTKHRLALTLWEQLTHWWAKRLAAQHDQYVSAEWLHGHRKRQRVTFDGPCWSWPIKKTHHDPNPPRP
jgi:hypothetical protein